MTIEQTAGEPVAWESLLRELRQCAATWEPQVVLLGNGNLTAARIVAMCDDLLAHPRPRVGVTAEDVKLLRSVCEYVAEERLVLLYESGFLRDMSLEGEFRASVAGLPDRVLALADSPAPLANGGGEVGP